MNISRFRKIRSRFTVEKSSEMYNGSLKSDIKVDVPLDVHFKIQSRMAWRRKMTDVKKGDNVKVHYTGKLTDGTVFDSSTGGEPLEFAVGSGQVIEGFEEGVVGMKVGDSKVLEIPVAKAYGERNDAMVIQAPIEQVPPDLNPELGMRLEMGGANGEILRVVVTEITDTHITLDANPPLAGEDLIFEIELVECAAP